MCSNHLNQSFIVRSTGKTISEYFLVMMFFVLLFACESTEIEHQHDSDDLDNKGSLIYLKGDSLYNLNNWKGAIALYLEAADAFEDISKQANVLNDIGLSYKKLGIYDSASKFYSLSLEIYRRSEDSAKMAFGLRNIGNIFRNQGNHKKALDYYLESLSISESLKNERGSAQSYVSLGNIYQDLDNNLLALSNYHKAQETYKALGDSLRLGRVLSNMGNAFKLMQQYDSALVYYESSRILKEKHADQTSLAFTLHSKGSVYLKLESLDSAEYYLKWAFRIREEVDDQKELAVTSNELARLYLAKNKASIALTYLNQARGYAKRQKNRTVLMNNLEIASQYHQQTGDYRVAFNLLAQWSQMRDSLFNQEKVKVLEVQSQYDLRQKEAERLLEQERADSEYEIGQNRLKIIWLAVALVILLLITLVIFFIQRKKIHNLNGELRLLNRDMFHRKRNDYSRILKSVDEAGFPETDAIRNMIFASNAVDDTLYADLNDKKRVNLNRYFRELLGDLSDSMELNQRKVVLTSQIVEVSLAEEKTVKLAFILSELITNSVKHSFKHQKGRISLSIESVNDVLRIIYKDDGAPIPIESELSGQGMGQTLIKGFLESLDASLYRERQDNMNVVRFEVSD